MKTLVVGAGATGIAVARFLARAGDRVVLTDRADKRAIPDDLRGNVELVLGEHRLSDFTGADRIVLSPGVDPRGPELTAARARGVPVTGEIELASAHVHGTLLAITGTNGKSTATSLLGAICAATGRPTFVGGNLGTPLVSAINTPALAPGGFCVLELSSYQLETCVTLRPHVAVLLNLTPDHLDRYDSMAGYGAAKARIFGAQTAEDFAVVHGDDAACVALATGHASRLVALPPPTDAELVLPLPAGEEHFPTADLALVGRHNLQNAAASYAAARLAGVPPEAVRAGARGFRPLDHRMQLVGEARGVRYFDDSKGTNVDAVVASVRGFPTPYVLICGGRDKGGSYAPLAEAVRGRARGVVLLGEAAPLIEAALGDAAPHERASSMDDAVRRAASLARPGDAVLLSPACSSFDMFTDYKDRGRRFQAAVAALACE